ncbi:MAG: MarR family transcriptional regulator [Bacteroidota bacterium]|nr:MarR family transcriptional regulator [Bacteroidota bacterium]
MKIEEEIKQKKFNSEYQKVIINILYTASWLSLSNNKFLKQFGISQEQYNVLRILRGQNGQPSSVHLICDRMIDKASNASRIVEKLRMKEYVTRMESTTDRRQVDIYITEKGLHLLKEADLELENFENNLKTLSKKEAEQLNLLLDKLRG